MIYPFKLEDVSYEAEVTVMPGRPGMDPTLAHAGKVSRSSLVRAAIARLTWPQVVKIRAQYGSGESRSRLALAYGVSVSQIALIVLGKSWKDNSYVSRSGRMGRPQKLTKGAYGADGFKDFFSAQNLVTK